MIHDNVKRMKFDTLVISYEGSWPQHRLLFPQPPIDRAVEIHTSIGCPVEPIHVMAVSQKGGTHPWTAIPSLTINPVDYVREVTGPVGASAQ